jgi:hypothetical protein
VIFKVPTDDEDDAMGDDITPAAGNHSAQLSPNGTWTHPQQQQQQLFVFSSSPSSQQGPVESMLWEHTRKLQAYAQLAAGEPKGGRAASVLSGGEALKREGVPYRGGGVLKAVHCAV